MQLKSEVAFIAEFPTTVQLLQSTLARLHRAIDETLVSACDKGTPALTFVALLN